MNYNSQRDNETFNNRFMGYQQCFSTSVWMLMSLYCDSVKAADDMGLAKYVDDVCNIVGMKGIGEEIAAKNHFAGNSAYYWEVQRAGLETWLHNCGVEGKAVFKDGCSVKELATILSERPAVIGTNKIGGLPGGHVILALSKTGNGYLINDPYGDAVTGYVNKIGDNVEYSDDMMKKHFSGQILYFGVS